MAVKCGQYGADFPMDFPSACELLRFVCVCVFFALIYVRVCANVYLMQSQIGLVEMDSITIAIELFKINIKPSRFKLNQSQTKHASHILCLFVLS